MPSPRLVKFTAKGAIMLHGHWTVFSIEIKRNTKSKEIARYVHYRRSLSICEETKWKQMNIRNKVFKLANLTETIRWNLGQMPAMASPVYDVKDCFSKVRENSCKRYEKFDHWPYIWTIIWITPVHFEMPFVGDSRNNIPTADCPYSTSRFYTQSSSLNGNFLMKHRNQKQKRHSVAVLRIIRL